ncbi:hypothetical protein OC835_007958, partial [Tilletia horrida]
LLEEDQPPRVGGEPVGGEPGRAEETASLMAPIDADKFVGAREEGIRGRGVEEVGQADTAPLDERHR